MLKSVRYGGFFVVMRNVHWLHALIAATIIVCAGPSTISDSIEAVRSGRRTTRTNYELYGWVFSAFFLPLTFITFTIGVLATMPGIGIATP